MTNTFENLPPALKESVEAVLSQIHKEILLLTEGCLAGTTPLKAQPYLLPGSRVTLVETGLFHIRFTWTQGVRHSNGTLGPTLSISAMELTPKLRGKGLLTELLRRLVAVDGIEHVMFEYVYNDALSRRLEKDGFEVLDWKAPFDEFFVKRIKPEIIPPKSEKVRYDKNGKIQNKVAGRNSPGDQRNERLSHHRAQ